MKITMIREWNKIMSDKTRNPYSPFTCPRCGYSMVWSERNCASHKRYHNHILDIEDKCGTFLDYAPREELKHLAYEMAYESNNIEDRKLAYLLEWYSRYMRSIVSYPDASKHPCFEDYISMILHEAITDKEEHQIRHNGRDVIESLVEEFGTIQGIPSGSYFYDDYSDFHNAPFTDYYGTKERPRNGISSRHEEGCIRSIALDLLAENRYDDK